MHLEDLLSHFLKKQGLFQSKVLLGLSGGPDSIALFYLLLSNNHPFEVAHIDHGWRKESHEESLFLERICIAKGIPFHLKRLQPPEEKKNLEEQGRNARLAFFKQICSERGLAGLLLAHHADDQAETVLKRVFEGATLPKLKGLLSKKEIEGLEIFRPLLNVKKQTILDWLNKKGISYFKDITNSDCRFLRSRLREKIIPTLTTYFGKEISTNLCRLGENAAELESFIEDLVAPYRTLYGKENERAFLDLTQIPLTSRFLLKCLIRDFCAQEQVSIPFKILDLVLDHVFKGSAAKTFIIQGSEVLVHKKRVAIVGRSGLEELKKFKDID